MEKQEKKPLSSAQVKYMQNRLHEIKVVKMRDIEREYDGLDDLGDILTEEIRDEMAKILDQVMLGDADRALKMLEDFTAKSF
jgi:hypothetical protein